MILYFNGRYVNSNIMSISHITFDIQIIVLGHGGFTLDKQIASEVAGVDIVVGGHSNTFLYTGR